MDLQFTPEEQAFRTEVQAFLKDKLPAELSRKVRQNLRLTKQDMERWHAILNERGWLANHWPKEWGGTGWSLAWKLCLRGRMQQPADAALLIKNQLRYVNPHSRFASKKGGGTYPNLFCAHPPFQIDGNYGFTAGIGELIAGGKLPEDWNGVVKGVKLRGGKTVNAKIQNGKLIPIK